MIYNIFIFNLLIFIINGNNNDNIFLFSVIISIYNTGKYLHESINSLLNQTIGFEKNIQLILVNDGSTDNSEDICLKYLNEYPKNIFYAYKDNGGLSTARNLGLKYVKGKYINFLDPDDKWSRNSFKLVSNFIHKHPNIDIIACRIKFFEGMKIYHPLDYKYYKTRVIDLNNEYKSIQLSAASSFFKSISFKKIKFVEGYFPGEDLLYINKFLLTKPFLGVIKKAIYYYRKRIDQTSIIQTAKMNDNFYFITPYAVYHHLLNTSLILYNKTLPFIEYCVAYEILFRIYSISYIYISLPKYIKYIQIIMELLKRVHDKYIIEQKILDYKIKFYVLSRKNNKDMRNYIILNNGKLKYKDIIIFNLYKNKKILSLIFIDIKDNILQIEAKDKFWLKRENYYFYLKIGKLIILPEYKHFKHFDYKIIFGNIISGRIVKFNIPIKKEYINQRISFHLSYLNNSFEILPSFGYYVHIPPIKNSYYVNDNFILIHNYSKFKIIKNSRIVREDLEHKYNKELEKRGKKEIIQIRQKTINYREKSNKKNIWIINDHSYKAGDNGEYFFRFLIKKNPCDIEYYYTIQNNCSDYIRLMDLGHILSLGSKEYKQTFLKADKIISSSSNKWVINPFGLDRKYLIDLFHFDLIFLQNGISKDDNSKYINRFNSNFSLIMTASKYEFKSFLSRDYDYSYKNIKLTGLSRFDNFPIEQNSNNTQKTIIIIPTWRSYIKGNVNPITYSSIYSDTFIKTEYYKFYNNLINSPKLLEVMERYNYSGIFCLHPYYIEQWKDFKNNSKFSIIKSFEHKNLLLKSSLLITDYSSVFFDFSYMKKPIIYSHFDYEQYRNLQHQKGYFDYLLDGFGPVCTNLDDCIDKIIKEILNGCKLKYKYLKRIKKFFTFFDNHNNDRIYKAIRNSYYNDQFIKNKLIKDIFIIIIIINFIFILKKLKKIKIEINIF